MRGIAQGSSSSALPIGKLPVSLLRTMLARLAKSRDPRLVVGPGIWS